MGNVTDFLQAPGADGQLGDNVGEFFAGLIGQNTRKIPRQHIVGSIVSLGDKEKFYFLDTEVPETLPIMGGYNVRAVHAFPGGNRAIDIYGTQPRPIEFSGELFSTQGAAFGTIAGNDTVKPATAAQRAQQLDKFRRLTTAVTFRFGKFEFIGVVSEFLPIVHHENHVSYTLKFDIIEDNTDDELPGISRKNNKPIPPSVNIISLISDLANSASAALAQATSIINFANQVKRTLQTNPSAVYKAGVAMIPGSGAVSTLITNLGTFANSVDNFNKNTYPQVSADLQAAKPYETLSSDGITRQLVPSVRAAAVEAKYISEYQLNEVQPLRIGNERRLTENTVAAYNYYQSYAALMRMLTQFQRMATPQYGTSMLVQDPNFRELALKHYQDGEQWQRIAKPNGFNDVAVTGNYLIKIPAKISDSAFPTLRTSGGDV
jgi:hypothetical protein